MSEVNNAVVDKLCCASCSIAEVDDIKLMECVDCDLVRYCSDTCQRNHKSQHKEECKKRAAELRDESLFRQPESSYLGDCPICCLPMSLDLSKSTMATCCSKSICIGCDHANFLREDERRLKHSCPFCREPLPATDEEGDKRRMKRVEVNDPVAICQEGNAQHEKGNYSSAFRFYTKAAELGDAEAHYQLALMYHNGHSVEKDEKQEIYHWEEAAIGGHPKARYFLGCLEVVNGRHERGLKHWIIAAKLGCDRSIKALMTAFREGCVSKDDLAAALRAHHAAVDATKSPQREVAEEFRQMMSSAD